MFWLRYILCRTAGAPRRVATPYQADQEANLLSVILPARNNMAFTRESITAAIQSLEALQLSCEFVLIDDASDPREGILELFRQIRASTTRHQFIIARAKERLHYTGVFSLGIHLSRMERIFFLSNDMLITPYFFTAVLAAAALDSKFGIVRGTSNYTDSHPEHTVSPPPNSVQHYKDIVRFSQEVFHRVGLTVVEDQILSGDAVLIARALIERIGVLDLQFFGYFGDVDFGMRAHLAGYKLVCAKGAWLWHEGAGHLKTEAKTSNIEPSVVHRGRIDLLETAYQAFRRKWDVSLPATYSQLQPLTLFPTAEKNAARVDLKYGFPPAALRDVDLL